MIEEKRVSRLTTSISIYEFIHHYSHHSTNITILPLIIYAYKSRYIILFALIAPQNARNAAVAQTAVVV